MVMGEVFGHRGALLGGFWGEGYGQHSLVLVMLLTRMSVTFAFVVGVTLTYF